MITLAMINNKAISEIIDKDFSIVTDAVIDSFKYYMSSTLHQPSKTKLVRPSGTSMLEDRIFALAAYAEEEKAAGLKWTSRHPDDDNHVLIILNETKYNRPIAILDGCLIGVLRTFAITKIALDLMFPDVKNVAIIGMGRLGRVHANYLQKLYPSLEKIKCYSQHAVYEDLRSDVVVPCASLDEVLGDVDVLVTCGRQRDSYIETKMLSSHTKLIINLSLFDLKEEIFENADKIFIDDPKSCLESIIPLSQAYKKGKIPKERIELLGNYILKNSHYFASRKGLAIVNTQGMAVEDVVLAKRIYDKLDLVSSRKFEIL